MAEASNILLVDDDVASINVMRKVLGSFGQLRFATSGIDALRIARAAPPDLVLLDVEMPGMNGFEVCRTMKSDPELHDSAIIFITSHDGEEQEIQGLSLGAVDFIAKPLRPALVAARVRIQLTMKAMADALRQAAATDVLTGVANRRRFEATLACEWSRMSRSCAPLSLLMIDVDYFKAFNDRYGHLAGDHCLAAVASAMRSAVLRGTDLLARYGGEEFAVLLPETDAAGAQLVAQRLLASIDASNLRHESSPVAPHVTASIGASTYVPNRDRSEAARAPDKGCTAMDLLHTADLALYEAKRAGRHRAHCTSITDAASTVSGPCDHEAELLGLVQHHA